MTAPSSVTISDIMPEDRLLLADIDVSIEPRFSVGEIAKVFFGRSSHWIRWNERKGRLMLAIPCDACEGAGIVPVSPERAGPCPACNGKGEVLEQVGAGRSGAGARNYDLADIEQMAHALATNGGIDGVQLFNALRIVHALARIYGYLAPEYVDPKEPSPRPEPVGV